MIKLNSSDIPLLDDYLKSYNFQLDNLYYFVIEGNSKDDLKSIDFFAKSHSIPMDTLEVESFPFGKKFYKGYTQVEDFEITFLLPDAYTTGSENPLIYFTEWLNIIYDYKNKCFKVLESEEDKYRNARLTLLTYDYDVNSQMSTAEVFIGSGFSKSFEIVLQNLMPLGFDNIEVDDETGDPMQVTMKFACEGVTLYSPYGEVLKPSGL